MILSRGKCLILSLLLTTFLGGCYTGKARQCEKLIDVVHRGNSLITAQGDRYDLGTTQQLAVALNGIASQVENLDLHNEELQTFQNGYSQSFREIAIGLTQMAQVLETGQTLPVSFQGRQQLKQAQQQMQKAIILTQEAGDRHDNLTQEILVSCPQKPSN
ncbi:MAG: hypothetical protein EA414_17640 [Arthrospira sp. PLM2.Bin9]|nr:hypothetical protein [Arthrospira sp. PLM2.Bin9]TVU52427.1 MAG: hypothetical protein EA414_17640 [Arthrospira sp. PLM2.Bin9]